MPYGQLQPIQFVCDEMIRVTVSRQNRCPEALAHAAKWRGEAQVLPLSARNPAIAVSLNRFSSTSACTRWRSIPVRPGNQDRTAAANPNVGSIPARAAEPLHLNSLQVRNLAGSCSPFPANDLTCPNENCASFCPLCGAMIA